MARKTRSDLILRGYLAFLDPPKDSARSALAALQRHGISVKVVTGDNELRQPKDLQGSRHRHRRRKRQRPAALASTRWCCWAARSKR